MNDTIFALSSGAPPAAIAVVRISGPHADAALETLSSRALPPPRQAGVRTLLNGAQELDTAVVLRFRGPASATGEDVVELHLHGGRATVAAVLTTLAAIPDLRPADPGEFTRRAFENGRIDLAQAEGLSDLLAAETELQRRVALNMAGGGLSEVVERMQRELLATSAQVEASIDFSDEDDVSPWPERFETLANLASGLETMLATPPSERLRDGVKIAIAGPPNAGKSTLINRLASRDVAIVSAMAGTTRDAIEVPLHILGIPLILIDTAGLRDASNDTIETMGIERASSIIATSDIVLWLGEAGNEPAVRQLISIHAKADLASCPPDGRIAVSALTGEGIDELLAALAASARSILPPQDSLSLNVRQRTCLTEVVRECHAAAQCDDLVIVAEHLRLARLALDRLTGRTGVDDMLAALFSTFCIGK